MRRCEAGGTTIEFAIIASALVLVSLGVVEFGRALHVRNELSFAADFAARSILGNPAVSNSALEEEVRSVLTSAEPNLLQISMGTETVDGREFRTVALRYPFTFLIPSLSSEAISLSLDRRVPII